MTKSFINPKIFVILILLIVSSCQQDEVGPMEENELQPTKSINEVIAGEDEELDNILQNLSVTYSGQRSFVNQLDLSDSLRAIKLENHDKELTTYSLFLNTGSYTSLSNLIVNVKNDEPDISIITYTPDDPSFLLNNRFDLTNFSGHIERRRLDGTLIFEVTKGTDSAESGRMLNSGCYVEVSTTWVSVDGESCGTSTATDVGLPWGNCFPVTVYEPCPESFDEGENTGGGGGSTSGDGSTSTGSGSVGGGSSSSGNEENDDDTDSSSGSDDITEEIPVISREDFEAQLWEQNNIELSEEFENNPCAKGVYDDLIENNDAFEFIRAFTGNNPSVNLDLKLDNGLPADVAGRTSKSATSGDISISLNPNSFEDYSSLTISLVLLHEFIHAQLFYESDLNDPDFNELFEEFANSQIGDTQHNIMINKYINPMATILTDIDNNRMGDIENYKAISYTGLKVTDLWVNTIAGTVDETIISQLSAATLNGLSPCL